MSGNGQSAAPQGREAIYSALFALAQRAIAASFAADTAAGSAVLHNVSSLANLRAGFPVIGLGIAPLAAIATIDGASQLTLTHPATASGIAVPLRSGFRTAGRRLRPWSQVTEQPAMFVRDVDEEYPPRPHGLARATLEAEIWIYSNAGKDPNGIPTASLDPLVDAVEASLEPVWPYQTQTLGGLCTHAWIEGRLMKDPGDLDQQAKAVIPVRILVGGPVDP
jgi:hypothetical protein